MVSDWIPSFLCFRAPPGLEGSRSPLRSGRCETNVRWTFRSLRSASVVAKRTSTGRSATSRALISRGIHLDIIFVFPIPPGLEGLRSPLNAKKQRKYSENTAKIHRESCVFSLQGQKFRRERQNALLIEPIVIK